MAAHLRQARRTRTCYPSVRGAVALSAWRSAGARHNCRADSSCIGHAIQKGVLDAPCVVLAASWASLEHPRTRPDSSSLRRIAGIDGHFSTWAADHDATRRYANVGALLVRCGGHAHVQGSRRARLVGGVVGPEVQLQGQDGTWLLPTNRSIGSAPPTGLAHSARRSRMALARRP